jgi:hypothetical protein
MDEASDSRSQTRSQQVLAQFVGESNVAHQLRHIEYARELVGLDAVGPKPRQESFKRNKESENTERT